MTNKRAREVAKKILSLTMGLSRPLDMTSHAEAVVLAYRDEVRREVLKEVKARSFIAPNFDSLTPEARDASLHAVYLQRGAFRAMLDEMIAEAGPPETTAPINTGGRAVVVGCDSPDAADRDFVLRTLAQAYVGNDYTIEGRKFQAAVERLWRR